MMKLSFDTDIDDIIAFHSNFYDLKYADKVAGHRRRVIFVSIVFVVFVALLVIVSRRWVYLAYFGLFAIVFIPLLKRSANVKTKWLEKMRKQIDIPENALWFGARTMEFDDERVGVVTGQVCETILWSAFVRWVDTGEHFFLYVSDAQAHTIPKRGMSAADIDDLTRLLNNKIKK